MTARVFHLIVHTHWDREWYLPRGALGVRLVAMLDDLIARFETDHAFASFLLDGQTVLIEDYLRARPDRTETIRSLVSAGRLQLGPWYVLADTQIPSAESLVRNLLFGTADAERLGHRVNALYSPDTFGHPAAWPALAREFGIAHGVVWRGAGPGDPSGDRFRWRAPDGRDVFVWRLPPSGYEIGAALPADAARLPPLWIGVRDVLTQRARGRHVAVFIGADHHRAHPAVGRLRDLIASLDPAATVQVSRLDQFLTAAAADGPAPAVTGERRGPDAATWVLQGTHGTRAPFKRRHGRAELWLERVAEPLAALARRANGADRRPQLEQAWRALLRCQFHDTICGTTSDVVTANADARLREVSAAAGEVASGALHDLVHHDADAARGSGPDDPGSLVLWNPAARPRGGVVIADVTWFRGDVPVGPPGGAAPRRGRGAPAGFALTTGDSTVPVQVLERRAGLERRDAPRHYPDLDAVDVARVAFRAPAVAGLGVAVLRPASPAPLHGADAARVDKRSLVNRWTRVTLEANGALTLEDRASRTKWSGLLAIESEGDAGDTYTFQRAAGTRTRRATGPITVRRITAGPLVAALEARGFVRQPSGRVVTRLVLTLTADSPVVRCALEIDNQAQWHRLRARCATGLRGRPAVAGSAFVAVERPVASHAGLPPRAGTPHEAAARTAPAHRWVAVAPAEGPRPGLAVLAPGFFEYELTAAGDVVVTLLRAVGELSRNDLPARPGHAAWPVATPAAQCLGPDRIELALAAVTPGDVARGDALPRLWEDVFLPVRAAWLRGAGHLAPVAAGVQLEGAGLVLSAVKPALAGAGTVLRCYNATERRAAGAWRLETGARAAFRVRADERESAPLVLEDRGRTIRFTAGPHEIVTVRIE